LPECGLTTFESSGEMFRCKKCGLQVKYTSTMELQGENFPFRYVADWYDYQNSFINRLDVLQHTEEPMYREKAQLSEVIINRNKVLLEKETEVVLYGNRVIVNGVEYSFDEVSAITVLGKNKLNIYHGGKVFQLKGNARFNALKYVNLYFRYKNITGENKGEEFLGL